MGHKVNPENFRVGYSVDWKCQLRDPLLANLMIYKTIKRLSLHYSAPYVMRPNDESVDPEFYDAMEQNYDNTRNPFLGNSLIFSHLNISYSPSLHIAIFMMDSNAELERALKRRPDRSLYYLTNKFFYRSYRFYRYFLKNLYRFKWSKKRRFALRWWHSDKYYDKLLPNTDLTLLLCDHKPQKEKSKILCMPSVRSNVYTFFKTFSDISVYYHQILYELIPLLKKVFKLIRKLVRKKAMPPSHGWKSYRRFVARHSHKWWFKLKLLNINLQSLKN